MIPDWCGFKKDKRRLPRGGPDRVRFAICYGDYITEGLAHEEALDHAFGCMRLFYIYKTLGDEEMRKMMGPTAFGLPIELSGEDE